MHALHIVASFMALGAVASYPTPSDTIVQSFPKTWLENVVARPNGHLLATALEPFAHVREITPNSKNPSSRIAYNFTSGLSTLGIAETAFDEFAVVVGNATVANLAGGAGSFEIWTLKYDGGVNPVASKAAIVTESILLNGMATLSENIVLVADSKASCVFKVDVRSGEVTKIIDGEPLMTPQPGPESIGAGINGIKIQDGTLYWTNTDQALIAGMPIHVDGSKAGDAKVFVSNLTNADDFTLAGSHGGEPVFLVTGFDQVRIVKNGVQSVVEQGPSVAGSTAVTESKGKFYVVTSGGVPQWEAGNVTQPGVVDELTL